MKERAKAALTYRGLQATAHVRAALSRSQRPGWPYCPADEGDLLHLLAAATPDQDALEVGCATGSTAAYALSGLVTGHLTSIDNDHDHFERSGERLIADLGLAARHTLLEGNSVAWLPELCREQRQFGLVFLDGWKSFDHIWVDTFYCARLLSLGGYIVLDDAQMPAVRKCVSLLMRYYGFRRIDGYELIGGWRLRAWHLLSTRSMHTPYVALQKTMHSHETDAGRTFDFWRSF